MAAPKNWTAQHPFNVTSATANTNRDGSGTIATLATGVAASTDITVINVTRTGTTTAGFIRFFRSADGGTSWTFWFEVVVPVITVTAGPPGTPAWTYPWRGKLQLKDTNAKLGFAPNNAEEFDITGDGVDY